MYEEKLLVWVFRCSSAVSEDGWIKFHTCGRIAYFPYCLYIGLSGWLITGLCRKNFLWENIFTVTTFSCSVFPGVLIVLVLVLAS